MAWQPAQWREGLGPPQGAARAPGVRAGRAGVATQGQSAKSEPAGAWGGMLAQPDRDWQTVDPETRRDPKTGTREMSASEQVKAIALGLAPGGTVLGPAYADYTRHTMAAGASEMTPQGLLSMNRQINSHSSVGQNSVPDVDAISPRDAQMRSVNAADRAGRGGGTGASRGGDMGDGTRG